MILEIDQPGIQTTVQDLGRIGFRRHGVSVGGALDPAAARFANILVGNEEFGAVLEIAMGGLRARFTDDRLAAWCGAPFDVRVDGQTVPAGRSVRVSAGSELVVAAPEAGLRGWLAISGGIDVPLVLGSRSTDLRAGFGGFAGRALREGDTVPLGILSAGSKKLLASLDPGAVATWGAGVGLMEPHSAETELRVIRGTEWVRFGVCAHSGFFGEAFAVAPESDRMGLRLTGPPLETTQPLGELVSAAVAPGTIQVPPEGQPILLMADCQTIGGYARIAHVITVDLPRAAQLRPGDPVRFSQTTLDDARFLRLKREQAIERFRFGVQMRMA